MPFNRSTLTQLRLQVAQDIESALPGSDALLRFSNLKITGDAQAALAFLHFGYLDYIAKNAVPFTSTGEFLEGWAGLKNVFRLNPTQASGTATFKGNNGLVLLSGTPLVRADGVTFKTTADGTLVSGTVTVPVIADADPNGQLGARGNTNAGVVITLGVAIAGIQSSGAVAAAFTGGSDLETDDSLRSRMLLAYQSAPEIGNASNYLKWARSVPGVTRAWIVRNGAGTGTVVVYTMLDVVQASHGGFPQGTDGVATGELRGVVATGDQLAVANYIFAPTRQPVTALVYSVSPRAQNFNFTIAGIPTSSAATRAALASAIDDVFLRLGSPGGTVPLSDIEGAIFSVPNTEGFIITSPLTDVICTAGNLPVRGTVTYS